MKKSILLASIVFFSFVFTVWGQTPNDKQEENHKFAILFQVNDFLSFSGFDGATFSGDYFISENSGVRMGISTNYLNANSTVDSFTGDTLNSSLTSDGKALKVAFSVIWIQSFYINKDIHLFGGGGLSYAFASNTSTTPNLSNTTTADYSDNVFGLPFVSGVEWFVKSNISLSLEYGVSFLYENEIREQKLTIPGQPISKNNSTIKSYRLKTEGIKMGIAFYF
jgi:opacity protein-like surface antigen